MAGMKAIISAAILLVLTAACGQMPGTATSASATPVVTASPTVRPTAAPSAKSSPQTTPRPSATLLFAVLEAKGTPNSWTYNTVAIAGLDGRARAKTTFAPIANPSCLVLPQSAHVAAGKVFFADGKGVVRSLAIDGRVAVAATFPLSSPNQMLSFAVSPDGTSLLGTVFTGPASAMSCAGSPAGTFTFDAYAATNGGSRRLLYHQVSSTLPSVLALTGWDSVGPLGSYPAVWWSQGGGPGSTLGVAVRVDPTTGKPGAQLSDPTACQVWDSVGSGSFVCLKDGVMKNGGSPQQTVNVPVSVRRADGTELWQFTAVGQNTPFGPYLSSDAQHVLICCNDLNLADSHEQLVGRDGSKVDLARGFGVSGWLNPTTVVGWTSSSGNQMAYVALSAPNTAVSMGFTGLFVGTVQG